MCTGLELALLGGGAGLSAGGSILGQREDEKATRAYVNSQNETLGQILAKNDPLAAENRAGFNTRVAGYAPDAFQGQQADLTAARTGTAKANITPAGPVDANISGSAPGAVQAEFDKRSAGAAAKSGARADAFGKLGGFGDVFLHQGLANEGTRRDFNVNNDLIRGNLTILPHLQQYAGIAAMEPRSALPGILKGVGSALGSFAGGMPGSAPSAIGPWTTTVRPG